MTALTESLEMLRSAPVETLGVLPYASNYTFLAKVGGSRDEVLAVYKPRRGERPLWDFPRGTLASREVGAFLLSQAVGWDIVPPTVLRADAPMGEGSLQLFIEHDPERHYFVLAKERLGEFPAFAAFDAVINNADRKAGHVLEGRDGKLWAVDHGLTFHVEPKLRTVIWAFAEQPLGDELSARLETLLAALRDETGLGGELAGLLSRREADATGRRVRALLNAERFPAPGDHHALPWPLV